MTRIEIFGWTLGGDPTPHQQDVQYKAILNRDLCSYCGQRAERMVVDHIVPRRVVYELRLRERDYQWDNLTAACRACSAWKGTHSLLSVLCGWTVGPMVRQGRVYR